MKSKPLKALVVASSVLLASCGGDGGGGGHSSADYWTMDAHSYVDGGYSNQATTLSGKPVTVVVMSTATLAGGDSANGAYSGSSLSFSFFGTAAGTYHVVPSTAALIAANPATNPIVVESDVGIAVSTGSTAYTASSGQVIVTVDSAGEFRFSSSPLPMAKSVDVLGGVVGAPGTMTLTIHDGT